MVNGIMSMLQSVPVHEHDLYSSMHEYILQKSNLLHVKKLVYRTPTVDQHIDLSSEMEEPMANH